VVTRRGWVMPAPTPSWWTGPAAPAAAGIGFNGGQIVYLVEIEGDAFAEDLERLVRHVDEIAEIPNSLRAGMRVRLEAARVGRVL
jgi:hypothetical protein